MFCLFRILWKRWIARRCKRNYTILPRRVFTRNRNSDNRFLRGFYCVSDSLPTAICLVVPIVLIILIWNGITFTDILYKVGWRPTVYISIAKLDSLDGVNFPDGVTRADPIKSDIEHNLNKTSKRVHGRSDSVIVWKVDGFSKYLEEFPQDDANTLGMFERLPSGKKLDRKGYGFWVYRFEPPKNGVGPPGSGGGVASIRALRITDHMNISPDEVEVAVAIRAYVDGEAAIVVKYEDSSAKHVHTEKIEKEEFKDKGFCYKILDIPFDKRINMIHIRPTSTNLRRHGIVIVDQVYIIVAKRDISQSVMHTLVPDNWC